MIKLKDLLMEIDDDQMIKYKDEDGESKEMKAGSAKTMGKDHPAKIEYEKQKDGGGDTKKGVNIFDKPADEPKDQPKDKPAGDDLDKQIKDTEALFNMYRTSPDPQYQAMAQGEYEKLQKLKAKKGDSKPEASGDDAKQIGGPNGLEMDRDDISTTLMNDPEIASILGDEDDVYWDDADLVSSKWDDATIASIDPDSPETIGDLKQRIKDYAANNAGAKEIEDLEQEIEELDNDIEDVEYELSMAQAGNDMEAENEAREKLQDLEDEKLEAEGKLKAAQDKSSGSDDDSVDDLRNKIEDLEQEIEEYDEGIEDAEAELSMAQASKDMEEEEYARDMINDMQAEKREVQIKLKAAQEKLSKLGESSRNIIPKGSLKRIQENWVKKNLL